MTKPKVLLVGFGGVGTIAALGLQWKEKTEVTAIVRSDYQRVVDHGFDIKSLDYGEIKGFRPQHVKRTVKEATEEYGPFDYIVVTTKNTPDIFKVEDVIQDAVIPKKTVIVLLQNGIGIEKECIKRFPGNIILSGVSMIASTNLDGVIHHEDVDKLLVGYFDNRVSTKEEQEYAAKDFVQLYATEHNDVSYDENTKLSRWRKIVYNGTLNPICALTGLDVARLEMFGGTEALVRPAMKEILAVAKSDGVNLPGDIMEFMIRSDDPLWYAPSMLVDVRKGNYVEQQVLCGNVIEIAKQNNISTPILQVIAELHKVLQKSRMEQKGLIKLPKERIIPEKK